MEHLRILIAKPGLDGHDRGARVVARAFRDAGWEVIYTGLRQTEEAIVRAAVDEDVDVLGISDLGAIHVPVIRNVTELLENAGRPDIVVVAGGTFVKEDLEALRELGVAGCYGPGSDTRRIVEEVKELVRQQAWFGRLRSSQAETAAG